MKVPKICLDSDLFVDHLCGGEQPSNLRLAIQRFFCYTTVFHAIELFALGRNEKEQKAIEDSMAAVKVLGLNAKNARLYGTMISPKTNVIHTLAAGLCLESKLPLLTGRPKEFKRFGIRLVPVGLVSRFETGEEILNAAASGGNSAG